MGMINDSVFVTDIEDEEILLSLKTLCSTYSGTCPLDREFGIDVDIIDNDIEVAKAIFVQDIIDKAEKYITEIAISEVEFIETDNLEKMNAIIYFGRKENTNEISF